MQSGKSHFNLTLYRKNLARFWPIWGLYLFLWTVALVVPLALNGYSAWRAEEYILDSLSGGLFMPFFAAPLAVMAVFSYLYRAAPANQIHSLPVRREGLFLTNFLSGLTFLWGPSILVCGLTLVTLAVQGILASPRAALLWLLVQCLGSFFFLAFAVFCAMFTGHLAALPAFYIILNFVIPGLYELVGQMLRRFLYGFYAWGNPIVDWFWPLPHMIDSVRYTRYEQLADGFVIPGLPIIWIYAAVGVVLLAAALLVYRRRHLERAGDVVSVHAMRPVFAYGVALCSAIVFGTLIHDWLNLSTNNETGWPLAMCMLVCGGIGYFAAHMLMEKSFRVLRRWRGCAAFLLALLLCCTAVEFDFIGVERRVPEAAESAFASNLSSLPRDEAGYSAIAAEDAALIAEITGLHRAIIERRGDLAAASTRLDVMEPQRAGEPRPMDYTTAYLSLHYTLPGGGKLQRRYDDIPVTEELLADPSSPAARLDAFLNRPDVRAGLYPSFAEASPGPTSAYLYDGERRIDLSTAQASAVYDAVRSDLAAGRLGRRFLLETREYLDTVCWDELMFSFPVGNDPRYTLEAVITLQVTATDTLEALSELGILSAPTPLSATYNPG